MYVFSTKDAMLSVYLCMYLINAHRILEILTVHMSHCYHLLYSLQYDINKLLDAAGDGRLNDVKEYVQIGVDVNVWNQVSNYIYTSFTSL